MNKEGREGHGRITTVWDMAISMKLANYGCRGPFQADTLTKKPLLFPAKNSRPKRIQVVLI